MTKTKTTRKPKTVFQKMGVRKIYLVSLAATVVACFTFTFFGASQSDELHASAIVASTTICTDSDGGKDYFKKGTVNSKDATNVSDTCRHIFKNSGGSTQSDPVDSCDGDECYVQELFCLSSGNLGYEETPCSNGCKAGACVAESTITVTSPNGGETLTVGQTYRIKWNAPETIDKVSIGYSSGPGSLNWIAFDIANIEYYDWTVNAGNTTNTQFKVRVIGYDTGVGSWSDDSDSYFTVSAVNTCDTIKKIWDGGHWSARLNSDAETLSCKTDHYNKSWKYSPPSFFEWQCSGIIDLWNQGNWTSRFGSVSEVKVCKNKPMETPTLARCREVKKLWKQGGWTARFGSTAEPTDCKNNYPEYWSEILPSETRCEEVKKLWDQGNWTARFGVAHQGSEPVVCEQHYPEIWHVDATNQPPVITGGSGPTSLEVNQKGTWKITANDPDGSYLNYSVDWGEISRTTATSSDSVSKTQSQTATFTHSYSTAGNYTVTLTVTDEDGASNESSMTVRVGDVDEDTYLNDVQGVSATPVSGGVRIAWQSVENADEYTIYFGTKSMANDIGYYEKDKVVGDVTEYVIKDLSPNTTYYFTVGADDSTGTYKGSYNHSEEVSATAGTGTGTTPIAGYEDEVITNPVAESNPFSDVSINNLAGKAAVELNRRGVIGGFVDGEFKGDRPVNRAEAAKFLLLARGIDVGDLTNSNKFADVKEGEWYVKFVMKAAEKMIIDGYSDGTFKPANTVNTAEFLKMMTKTFSFPTNLSYTYADVETSDWFAQFAGAVQKYDLFPNRGDRFLEPARDLTRDEVAVAIYQYLLNR